MTQELHSVLGSSLHGPWPARSQEIYFGMGCFWGAEKKFWVLPGIVTTSVGYMGGTASDPSYELVCTGRTGHAEIVRVVYNPAVISTYDVLKVFWENHDPTQGNRQGNDIGTQYRSAVYWTNPEQEELVRKSAAAYQQVLASKGFDPITTELRSADGLTYWFAEDYHQQYLYKVPHGYDCHAHTGIDLPALASL